MKKIILVLLFFSFAENTDAQVGINNTAPKAQLDISASNIATPANTDGILIPRINAFPVTNPTVNQNGMMVFLTTVSGVNQPGFYYWNSTSTTWVPFLLGNSSSVGWALGGNTGTTPGPNYVGTKDNVDLVLKTNGLEQIRVKNDGRIEMGSNGSNAIYKGQTSTSKKLYVASGNASNNVVFQSSTPNNDPLSIYIGNSSGTVANPTQTQPNTQIGNIFFTAFDGNEFLTAAGIRAELNGGVSNDNIAGELNFLTNPGDDFAVQRMVIKSTGNVGINTFAPTEKLHVVGSVRIVDGNESAGKIFTSDATGVGSWQPLPPPFTPGWSLNGNIGTTASNFIGTTDNQNFAIRTNNVERLKVLATGELGIGTATPTRKFHIHDNGTSTTAGQLYLEQSGTGDALIHLGNTGARHFNLGLDTSDDSFKIGTNATTATSVSTGTLMTIQPTGEVGIGTTNPLQRLHVSGPAGLVAARIANTSGTGATSNVALDFFRATTANTDWRIYNVGPNLTIGNSGDDLATVNDLYQFQANRFMPMNDAAINLGQTGNRWNTLFASNGTINTSDARQKKNIQDINYGLNDLMKLRPVSFEWKKDDGSGTKLGLIAQELQQIIPEVVRDWDWEEDAQGNRKKVAAASLGVYYSDIIPVLIKSIQEQQQMINEQSKTISEMQKRLEYVENKK